MRDCVSIYETEDTRVKIYVDEDPIGPEEYSRLGKLWIFHKRHCFGDKPTVKASDFSGWDEMEEHLVKEENAGIVLPVFMLDHSGITISTSSFSCPWDSGRVGFIWCSVDDLKKEYSVEDLTPEIVEKAQRVLESEIKTWDQWLTGDVYVFETYTLIRKDDGVFEADEFTDCCGGFYGSEKDDIVHLLEHALGEEGAKKAKQVK